MPWQGYTSALVSDPGGVAINLATRIKTAPERVKHMPDVQTELAHVIEIESTWLPDIQNPTSKATGLIQFMPSTAKDLGTTVDQLRKMTRAAQSDYVQKYFDKVNKTAARIGDIYLMVAAPGFVEAPDDKIVYPVGGQAWKQNPGWRSPGDGPVTAGSIRKVGTPPTEALPGAGLGSKSPGGQTGSKPAGGSKKPPAKASSGGPMLALFGLALFLMNRRRK